MNPVHHALAGVKRHQKNIGSNVPEEKHNLRNKRTLLFIISKCIISILIDISILNRL